MLAEEQHRLAGSARNGVVVARDLGASQQIQARGPAGRIEPQDPIAIASHLERQRKGSREAPPPEMAAEQGGTELGDQAIEGDAVQVSP
jgi:hypothetical protein